MFDLMDVLHGKAGLVLVGRHYTDLPGTTNALKYAEFNYEHADLTEWHYQKLLGNVVNAAGATLTIKSSDDLPWAVGQYLSLQDEKTYEIVAVTKDVAPRGKQAFRYLKDVVCAEYVLSLQERPNPWGA